MKNTLPKIQQELKNQLYKFRLKKIEPYMEEDDKNQHFRWDIFKGLGELGFCGITTPEQYQGAGMSIQDLCLVLHEISKSSVSYAITVSVSTMVQNIFKTFGNNKQKERYLPPLALGNHIGAFCLTESHSGSDSANLKTTAKKVSDGYKLNGSKMWVTSGEIAETYIIMARTNPNTLPSKGISAFIIPKDTPGLSFGKKENKMGWRVSPTREIILKDCLISEENLLGKEGQGFNIAMNALDKGRITVGAIAVGLSERALEEAIQYSLERKQFQKPLFDFQGLQFMIADMATELESSRLLVQQAASLYDEGKPSSKITSMAKLKSTDTCMSITTDAVQILGAVGYTTEYPLERMMRDAKVLQIVEGANQIQKVIIASAIKKEYS